MSQPIDPTHPDTHPALDETGRASCHELPDLNRRFHDQLIPIRRPTEDLFLCDVGDAVLKDIMPQLEHPFYSLSKKPEMKVRRYEHNGNWLEVIPSFKGLATIYDKDLLIYCISKLIERRKQGLPIGPRVRIIARDLLAFTNRGDSGRDYAALSESIDRLAGTRIKTNIRTGDLEQESNFGLINRADIQRKHGIDGRLQWVEIVLSDWVMNAVQNQEVLTLHRDYFRLRKPLERRIYEIARKHCGRQPQWTISLSLLLKKAGSQGSLSMFRTMVKNIARHDYLPDYSVAFKEDEDQIVFTNRDRWWEALPVLGEEGADIPQLPTRTFEDAKKVAPGLDVYALEQEWREWWVTSGKPVLANPPAAFVGFCARKYQGSGGRVRSPQQPGVADKASSDSGLTPLSARQLEVAPIGSAMSRLRPR